MFAQPGFETQLRQFTESQNNRRQSLYRNFEVRLFYAHLHTLKTIHNGASLLNLLLWASSRVSISIKVSAVFFSCYPTCQASILFLLLFSLPIFFAVEKVNKNDKIVLFSKIIHGIQVFHNYLVVCLKIFKKFSTAISTANVAKFGN